MSTADAIIRLPLQTTLNCSQVPLPGDLVIYSIIKTRPLLWLLKYKSGQTRIPYYLVSENLYSVAEILPTEQLISFHFIQGTQN